jgi:hypothetical protein
VFSWRRNVYLVIELVYQTLQGSLFIHPTPDKMMACLSADDV